MTKSLEISYRVLDYVICLFVVTPCVVVAFRGLWLWEDAVLFPENPQTSCVLSFCLGHLTILAFYLGQDVALSIPDSSKKPLLSILVPLYKLLWSCAFINQWRCVWIAYDLFLDPGLTWALKALILSVLSLAACRALCLVDNAPPHVFAKPKLDNPFECRPRFGTQLKKSLPKNVLDCCFSVLVIQSLVVVFWKSAWTLVDVSLQSASCPILQLIPLVFGIVTISFSYAVQNHVHSLTKRLKGFTQILCQDVWYTIGGLCCVVVWHGVWSTMDLWLGFEPLVSYCSFVSSMYVLTSFFDVSLVYIQSIVEDGVVLFPISFFSDLLASNRNDGKGESTADKLNVKLLDTLVDLPQTNV